MQGGRIILGDNPAGRCFVLKGLILINFFNCFKIRTACKIFGKISERY